MIHSMLISVRTVIVIVSLASLTASVSLSLLALTQPYQPMPNEQSKAKYLLCSKEMSKCWDTCGKTASVSVCLTKCGKGMMHDTPCGLKCQEKYDACYSLCYPKFNKCFPTICGNGKIEYYIEKCDDGNTTKGDGCMTNCLVEYGWHCSGSPSVCNPDVCGNGECEGSEWVICPECAADGHCPCSLSSCPQDCGGPLYNVEKAKAVVCGDGKCDGGESFKTCPKDCGEPGFCYQGTDVAERPGNCVQTTKMACVQGGRGMFGIWFSSVEAECMRFVRFEKGRYPQKQAVCGDGKCDGGESLKTCPKDCGEVKDESDVWSLKQNIADIKEQILKLTERLEQLTRQNSSRWGIRRKEDSIKDESVPSAHYDCAGKPERACWPFAIMCGTFVEGRDRGTPVEIAKCPDGSVVYRRCDRSTFNATVNACK